MKRIFILVSFIIYSSMFSHVNATLDQDSKIMLPKSNKNAGLANFFATPPTVPKWPSEQAKLLPYLSRGYRVVHCTKRKYGNSICPYEIPMVYLITVISSNGAWCRKGVNFVIKPNKIVTWGKCRGAFIYYPLYTLRYCAPDGSANKIKCLVTLPVTYALICDMSECKGFHFDDNKFGVAVYYRCKGTFIMYHRGGGEYWTNGKQRVHCW